jgi:hypothetical protein
MKTIKGTKSTPNSPLQFTSTPQKSEKPKALKTRRASQSTKQSTKPQSQKSNKSHTLNHGIEKSVHFPLQDVSSNKTQQKRKHKNEDQGKVKAKVKGEGNKKVNLCTNEEFEEYLEFKQFMSFKQSKKSFKEGQALARNSNYGENDNPPSVFWRRLGYKPFWFALLFGVLLILVVMLLFFYYFMKLTTQIHELVIAANELQTQFSSFQNRFH